MGFKYKTSNTSTTYVHDDGSYTNVEDNGAGYVSTYHVPAKKK